MSASSRKRPASPGDAEGRPLVSGELYVIVDGTKRASQTDANLPLRGVGEQALNLREGFEIVEGRMFEPGTNELVVGASVLREFDGFDLGTTIRLGANEWVVVGSSPPAARCSRARYGPTFR